MSLNLMANLTAEDHFELQQVQAIYGHVFDGQWEHIDRVFTDDAVLDPTNVGLPFLTGRDTIRSVITWVHRQVTTCHLVTNSAVMHLGDDGVASVLSKYIVAVDGPNGKQLNFGYYHDECVKTPAGWRISKRRLERIHLFGGHEW